MPVYAKHLRTLIQKDINHPENYDRPLEGFHIVVDPGNGSGGFLTSQVLEPLGANTAGGPCSTARHIA
jgi:phosphomannomutase